MKKLSVGFGAALGLVLTGLGVPAASAVTVPQVTSVKASNVVVYAGGFTTHDIYVTVNDPENLVFTDPDRIFDVYALPDTTSVSKGWNEPAWYGEPTRTADGATYDTYKFTLSDYYYADDARGWRHVIVDLWAGDTQSPEFTKTNAFKLQSNITISSFNATEPVKKGYQTKITGKLTKLEYPWQSDGYQYRNYANKTLTVQFKKAGTTTWVNKGTVTTNSYGNFTKYVTADYDGTWRVYFPGNSWARSRYSSGDYVDVY